MNRTFWFYYSCFFAFVFPLFFSFSANFTWSPIWSTVSLGIGLIAWIFFIRWTYKTSVSEPKKLQKNIREVVEHGQLEQGRVLRKALLKQQEGVGDTLEVDVEFKNLSGTIVQHTFEFIDSKPHNKRYEVGNVLNLRLNREGTSPSVLLADTQSKVNTGIGVFAVGFVLVYMIGTFIVHYAIFSNGDGWRFVTLWHPWVFTPFTAYFVFNIGGLFGKMFGGNMSEDKLLLYGKRAQAKVQKASQTGTYINEQPQVRFILNYQDDKGQEHVVDFKQIVSLTEMHVLQKDTRDILYLPNEPQNIVFLD